MNEAPHAAIPETLAEQKRKLIMEKLVRELGPTIMGALSDPKVVEIMLNPDGILWFDVLGEGMKDSGTRIGAAKAENMLGTIAAMLDVTVNHDNPVLQGELPIDGSRFEGIVSPVVRRPVFAIRLRPRKIFSLPRVMMNGTTAYAIHAADGTQMAIAGDQDLAVAAIHQHEMLATLVH